MTTTTMRTSSAGPFVWHAIFVALTFGHAPHSGMLLVRAAAWGAVQLSIDWVQIIRACERSSVRPALKRLVRVCRHDCKLCDEQLEHGRGEGQCALAGCNERGGASRGA